MGGRSKEDQAGAFRGHDSESSHDPARGKRKMQVMKPCPGLWSVILDHELATSRGLEFRKLHEYSTLYSEEEEVPVEQPHRIGNLCVDLFLFAIQCRVFMKFSELDRKSVV